MAGQRLGGRDRRNVLAEHITDRLDLAQVTDGCRGGVRVDVVDLLVDGRQGLPHAAGRTFAGWLHHVVAIGGGTIADQFAVDLCAARLGVFKLFQHQRAAAAGNDEAVAVLVIGARGLARRCVEVGRHRAHGVEQYRQGPVQLLAAASEHDVLLAPLDQFCRVTNAMGGRGAG